MKKSFNRLIHPALVGKTRGACYECGKLRTRDIFLYEQPVGKQVPTPIPRCKFRYSLPKLLFVVDHVLYRNAHASARDRLR